MIFFLLPIVFAFAGRILFLYVKKKRWDDRLFNTENPDDKNGVGYQECLNPESLVVLSTCLAEPSLASATAEQHFQFEREGYFCVDRIDSKPGAPVFNRTVTLRDSWSKGGN